MFDISSNPLPVLLAQIEALGLAVPHGWHDLSRPRIATRLETAPARRGRQPRPVRLCDPEDSLLSIVFDVQARRGLREL